MLCSMCSDQGVGLCVWWPVTLISVTQAGFKLLIPCPHPPRSEIGVCSSTTPLKTLLILCPLRIFLFFLLQLRLIFPWIFLFTFFLSSNDGNISSSLIPHSSLSHTFVSLTFKAKACPQQLTGFCEQPCISRVGVAASEHILHFCVSVDTFASIFTL